MRQGDAGHALDVLGGREVAVVEHRRRARQLEHREHAARRGTHLGAVVLPRGARQIDDVLADRLAHVHLLEGALHRQQVLMGHHRLQGYGVLLALLAAQQDLQLLLGVRVADADAHDEAANAAGAPPAHAWRYPTPYRDTIEKYSDKFGLEEAFVYALIRRESRFMPDAISSAKARGLMQVLPSTAKTVARRHGYSRYRLSRLTRVDTNVIIGTTYLRDLGRQFGAHPAQVAAAYNAGPGRAKKWRRNINDTLALVENIPFRETRLYVKALLAARAHYALRFGAPSASIRELIDREIFVPQTASVN